MSLRWPAKDPDEILNFSADWSRFLLSDSITSVQWFVISEEGIKTVFDPGTTVDGLTLQSRTNTAKVATAKLSGGTLNKEYRIVCQVTFGPDALTSERTIILPIRER